MNMAKGHNFALRAVAALVVGTGILQDAPASGITVNLVEEGKALMPVVVATDACDSIREAAAGMADYLGRISGADIEIIEGNGDRGIVLGMPESFTDLPFETAFETDPLHREDYRLRSTATGLYLLGATPLAVHNAVWDVLQRFGYRMFFPTATWEVIPSLPDLQIAVNVDERPDYYSRRVWHATPEWSRRNRTDSGFILRSGHAYGGIIRRNREAFAENPEFLALRGGERGGSKFCISNPGLRELVVADAIARTDADTDSISMDPSDGGGWCECEACDEMGSVSDRVVILANAVAEAINTLDLGPKYVGIYAYASHSPPPSVDIHPKVIVNIATSFIRGGFTADQLVAEWGRRANKLGLREYYYSYANLPGGGRATDLVYLTRTLTEYHAAGVRFNSANIHDSWGPTGLGHYLMARIMWDIDAADRIEQEIDDFLDNCFAEARKPMRRFYRRMVRFEPGQPRALLSEDLVGNMYRDLAEARTLSDDPSVQARLNDLILYTRHVELYHQTQNLSGDARQKRYEDWVQHSFRFADSKMIHTQRMDGRHYAPGGVTPVDRIEGRLVQIRAAATPYTDEQIDSMLAEGIANNALLDFEPIEFSDDLVPVTPLNLPETAIGDYGNAGRHRGTRTFYIWMNEPGDLRLRVRGGITYSDRGPVQLELFSPLNELEEAEDQDLETVLPDQEWYDVVLHTPYAGLHRLVTRCSGGRHQIEFPEDMPECLRGGFRAHVGIASAWFYVPRGTTVVGGYVDAGSGGIWDAEGNRRYDFEEAGGRGYFSVPVPEGQDGRAWRVRAWRGRGQLRLMTVPNYLAREARLLLLPREVVEADSVAVP